MYSHGSPVMTIHLIAPQRNVISSALDAMPLLDVMLFATSDIYATYTTGDEVYSLRFFTHQKLTILGIKLSYIR